MSGRKTPSYLFTYHHQQQHQQPYFHRIIGIIIFSFSLCPPPPPPPTPIFFLFSFFSSSSSLFFCFGYLQPGCHTLYTGQRIVSWSPDCGRLVPVQLNCLQEPLEPFGQCSLLSALGSVSVLQGVTHHQHVRAVTLGWNRSQSCRMFKTISVMSSRGCSLFLEQETVLGHASLSPTCIQRLLHYCSDGLALIERQTDRKKGSL